MYIKLWHELLTKAETASFLGDGNTLYEIGGRDPEVTQLVYSVSKLVKDYYPINEVPQQVVLDLTLLMVKAVEFENQFHRLIERIAVEIDNARRKDV